MQMPAARVAPTSGCGCAPRLAASGCARPLLRGWALLGLPPTQAFSRHVQDEEASAAATRPPLGPGCVLRLRPPKAPAVVEVALDSGSKRVQFPEPNPSQQEQQQGGTASWEPLQAPPCSGYRFEAHLQRIAADLPPELVAAVEARRERGRRLAEARERAREEAAGAAGRQGRGLGGPRGSCALHSQKVSPPAILEFTSAVCTGCHD